MKFGFQKLFEITTINYFVNASVLKPVACTINMLTY